MYRHLYYFRNIFSQSLCQEIKKANLHSRRGIHSTIKISASANNHFEQISPPSPDFIQLKLGNNEFKTRASTMWLRHHCRCSTCFNATTNQRIQIPSLLKETPKIRKINVEQKGELKITWTDSHVSTYKCQWLQENLNCNSSSKINHGPLEKRVNDDHSTVTNPRELWTPYEDFMRPDNKGLIEFLSNVKKHGYGIIVDAPPNVESTNAAILRISHPQSTIYGDFYEFTADMSHADTAYTSDYVHLHTDTTYFSEPIGLQVFHCLYHDGEGGLNSIVDGYQIAQEIQNENPRGYQTLTNSLIPWQYVDPEKYLFYQISPIFSHNQFTQQLECVRYNPHDMAVLNTIQQDLLPEFYDSLIHLSCKIESSPTWIKLQPGMILFLDNWRMFHGRNTFTGVRKMCGSYISRSDWMSKCRVLNVK